MKRVTAVACAAATAGAGLFGAALAGYAWAPTAGWGVAAAGALAAALACAGAAGRMEVDVVRRPVWRRLAFALCAVAVVATFLLVERLAGGVDAEGEIGAVHAVAQAVPVLLLTLPLYRLPGSEQQSADRVAQALEVIALMVVTALYVWFFVISEFTSTDSGVVTAGALIVSATAGVLLGARILLTGYVSPYRKMLLRLGGVMVLGGLAPGMLLGSPPYEVDTGLISSRWPR